MNNPFYPSIPKIPKTPKTPIIPLFKPHHIQIMMKSLIFPTRTAALLIPTLIFNSPKPSFSSISNSVPFRNPGLFRSRKLSSSSSSVCCYSSGNGDNNLCEMDGEVHVIVGPMFAGKTTTLLKRIKSESTNGRNVAIIKSSKDTRYGLDSIVTHDGEKLPCWPLEALSSFKEKIGLEAYRKLEVIGIDEAQFFEDLYDFCINAADHDGKTVIVAGLDGDYLRRSFGVLDIIPIAESVTKLKARCELCGKPASFTLRKTEETERELVAGADVYMPVCRNHYASGQVVKEAARTVLQTHKLRCGTFS